MDGLKISSSMFQFQSSETSVNLSLQIPEVRTDIQVNGAISWNLNATAAEKEEVMNAASRATECYPCFFPDEVSENGTEDGAAVDDPGEIYEYGSTDDGLKDVPQTMEFYPTAHIPLMLSA